MSALSAGDLGDLGDLQLGANDQLFPSSSFLGDFLAQLAQETEDGGTPGPSEAGGDGLHGKRKPRVRPRTERAVQLNRAAQARYRERKRTRVQELEHTVGELQQRLQQLQSRAQEQEALRREVEMEKQILQLEKEAALLSGSALPKETAPKHMGEVLEELQTRLATRVAALKSYLASLALEPRAEDGSPPQVGPAAERHLQALIDGVRETCIAAARLQGPDVQQLLGPVEAYKALASWSQPGKWLDIVRLINPTEAQRQKLLSCRGCVLAELSRIYTERQEANEEALQLLLSGAEDPSLLSGEQAGAKGGLFGFISNFWDRLGVSSKKGDVLKRLQRNLEEEQRLMLHTEHEVLHKLLSPYQAAQAITAAFPDHCDALALLNAVHELSEQQ